MSISELLYPGVPLWAQILFGIALVVAIALVRLDRRAPRRGVALPPEVRTGEMQRAAPDGG